MKKFKTIIACLALVSTVFLGACGGSNINQSSAINNVETTVIKQETEAETTAETARQIETIARQAETKAKTIEQTTEQTVLAQQNINNEVNEENEMPTNEILVAYFSATGTTKRVAEKIAQLEGADIYEIVPKDPYTSADLNWHDNNSRTTKEMNDPNVRPEIGSFDIDLTQYKKIYLGYPIWWGDAPRIMATFVEKYNFDGKKVIPFCTSGGSGIGRSGSNLASCAKSGNFTNGERLNSSADTNNVQNFINNNK